jgi:hypothetical protein
MRYRFFGDVMPCHWGFGFHCFETLKWSHLKGLRVPRRPFDTVSHPRRMDAGYYNLLFSKGEVNLGKHSYFRYWGLISIWLIVGVCRSSCSTSFICMNSRYAFCTPLTTTFQLTPLLESSVECFHVVSHGIPWDLRFSWHWMWSSWFSGMW